MKTFYGCITVLGLFLLSTTAFAHKFIMSAWVEGDSVFVEAAFGDGSLAHQAKIEVFDNGSGKMLLSGETDDEGMFSFKIPQKVELLVKGNAGMGHQGEQVIPLEDITAALPGGEMASVSQEAGETDKKESPPAKQGEAVRPEVTGAAGISPDELSRIVEAAVEKKLRPIVRKLATAEQDKRPSPQDILGGIGYIIGLVGMGTYINYRSRKK